MGFTISIFLKYTYVVSCVKMLYFLNRFRRQHEQLRQVIVRVLRPVSSSKAAVMSPSEEIVPKLEPVVDEAADANAIEVQLNWSSEKEIVQK